MKIRNITALTLIGLTMALLLGVTSVAQAVDGVILIDQNRALAGNVSPGDTAGFPVTITQPGSYRLSGNLTVPNENTTAILIAANNVTIDLNGFAILGPANCAAFPCTNTGNGNGFVTDASRFNIVIRNGTIQGMGRNGIDVQGESIVIEQMRVRSNGRDGINVGVAGTAGDHALVVRNNTVERNGGDGMNIDGGLVSHNVVRQNGVDGIRMATSFGAAGSAVYNTVLGNVRVGLVLDSSVAYSGNVMVGNGNPTVVGDQVSGGVNLGQNLCINAACPGATF